MGLLFPVNHAPMKLASLTGFAPVISCMRGRHVDWTTPQGQKDGEGKRICTFDLMHVTHPLWLAELCSQKLERVNGVAPMSRPWHGRVLLLNHARKLASPAGLSPATWSLGHSRSVL